MRKITRNPSHSGSQNSNCIGNMVLLPMAVLFLVAVTGCQNQADKSASDRFQYNKYARHVSGAYYPNFIFDADADTVRQVSSEDFGRYEWPGGAQTRTYVSQGEQISYREYFYDDQYVNSSSEPQVRFRRRIQGYRVGRQYR